MCGVRAERGTGRAADDADRHRPRAVRVLSTPEVGRWLRKSASNCCRRDRARRCVTGRWAGPRWLLKESISAVADDPTELVHLPRVERQLLQQRKPGVDAFCLVLDELSRGLLREA